MSTAEALVVAGARSGAGESADVGSMTALQMYPSIYEGIVRVEKVGDPTSQIVLPTALREKAKHAHHLSYYAAHFGLSKAVARFSGPATPVNEV